MKKLIIIVLGLVIFACANAQTIVSTRNFILIGTTDTHTRDTIDVQYVDETGKTIKDSIITDKTNFVIKGFIREPTNMWFSIRGKDQSYKKSTNLFIEPAKMKLQINKENINLSVLSGSHTQNELNSLTHKETFITAEVFAKNGKYSIQTDEDKREIKKEKIKNLEFSFISTHPDSYLSPYLMKKYASHRDRDTLNHQYDKLSAKIKNSVAGQEILAYLRLPTFLPQDPKAGDIAPDFIEKGFNGEEIRLSSYRKKTYVLLDFWASWCGPCMKMLPKIKDLYAKYHDAGLEVIGINIDYTRENWKKSVTNGNMTHWKNIFPMRIELSNECPLIAQYGITTIPALFLIDKEGKIINIFKDESNLDKDLSVQLNEIFK